MAQADETYVEKRCTVNSEIDDLFNLGALCGFTPSQVADDILDTLHEHGIHAEEVRNA
jgi:hypothetical protein